MTESNNLTEKEKQEIVSSEQTEDTGDKQSVPVDQKEKEGEKGPQSVSVVGVRFRSCGKVYTFEVGDIEVSPGTKVVVDSKMGLSMGNVVTSKHIMERKGEPLKKVLRIANEQDFETTKNNREFESEARAFCVEKVKSLNLPMKIVTTETTLDKKRIVFYFTADGRIDFRELVRDLAGKFKTRIEMRQIGVRDEVKLLGGIGCCGRQACCSLFLTSFEPVTIRMAKKQDLSINQSKLSGICGRLMCCLGYEYQNGQGDPSSKGKKKDNLTAVTSGLCDEAEVHAQEEPDKPEPPVSDEKPDSDQPLKDDKKVMTEDQKTSAAGKKKRYFKRHKRRSKKHDPEKKPETSAQDTASEGEGKTGRTKPFNKRKRFWKKKKKES